MSLSSRSTLSSGSQRCSGSQRVMLENDAGSWKMMQVMLELILMFIYIRHRAARLTEACMFEAMSRISAI